MSKDIKKALEHCIEWNCDNCPNREELGSGEIVCRGRLLPEVLEYVADLEAKLAERNEYFRSFGCEDFNEFKDFISTFMLAPHEEQTLIQELQKRLEEKEEYINTYFVSQINQPIIQPTQHQDKISFAVEQLEKVKELMRNIDMPNKPELYNNDMFGAGFDSHYIRVEKLIDNQINVLRNNKDGIH